MTMKMVDPCIIYSHRMIIRPLLIVSSLMSSHTHVGVEVLSTHRNVYESTHAHCHGKILGTLRSNGATAMRTSLKK